MASDPIMDIISKKVEAQSIEFANFANKSQIDIDTFIESLPDSVDIQTAIKETKVVSSIIDSYTNRIESKIKELVHQLAQTGMDQELYKDAKTDDMYEWVLGKNHRHCPDCSGRAGRKETMKTWSMIGKPETGNTLCGGYCHCELRKV